jgi:hypothetical protein
MQIDFVKKDDESWLGVYFDGYLVYQDQSITMDDFVDLLVEHNGSDIEVRSLWANPEWLDNTHTLPNSLSEVELSVEE